MHTNKMEVLRKKRRSQYNPDIRNNIPTKYLVWLIGVSILIFLIGAGSVICAAIIKSLDSDIDDLVFHLWVGIPLITVSVFGVLAAVIRKKIFISLFLILTFFTMVASGFGAVSGGIYYWDHEFARVKDKLDDDQCVNDGGGNCACPDMFQMPSIVSCDDLLDIARLMIAEFSLAAFGMMFCFVAVLLSMMIICCGPWTYVANYSQKKDGHRGEMGGRVNAGYR